MTAIVKSNWIQLWVVMSEQTTITVGRGTKQMLQEYKPESVTWDVFMRDLVAERDADDANADVVRLSEDQYKQLVKDIQQETANMFSKQLEDLTHGEY